MFKVGQMVKRVKWLEWWIDKGFDPNKAYEIIAINGGLLKFNAPWRGSGYVKGISSAFKSIGFPQKYIDRMKNA